MAFSTTWFISLILFLNLELIIFNLSIYWSFSSLTYGFWTVLGFLVLEN